MRINAVRGPILVSAMLTAVFVPLVTSSHAALGVSVGMSDSASASTSASPLPSLAASPTTSPSPSPSASASASPSASPSPTATPSPSSNGDSTAALGTFYRAVLDVRPDMPGITAQQYYGIGQAFCTRAELSENQFIDIQQAYAMPAVTLDYDPSIAMAMVEAAPLGFIEENQGLFGFGASDLDTSTLNAFRLRLCADHSLWISYQRFVFEQLESLGPWQTNPAYNDPAVAADMWRDDLADWSSALGLAAAAADLSILIGASIRFGP